MMETNEQRVMRRLRLVMELYDEDEYVVEVAREALEIIKGMQEEKQDETGQPV